MPMTLLNPFFNKIATQTAANIKAAPLAFFLGMNVFALVVMGTSIRHVSSTVFAILVITAIVCIRDWSDGWRRLTAADRLLVAGFFLYLISALVAYYNVDDVDKYVKLLERYLRFVLIVPVLLVLVKRRITLMSFLFAGAIASGPFILAVAVWHYIENPELPAQGYYHHIIFGQLAVLNTGMMLVLLLKRNPGKTTQLVVSVSMVCALVAAILSQARGVWLVLPVYLLIAGYYAWREKRLGVKSLVAILALILAVSVFTPVGDVVGKRVNEAVTDVEQFYRHDVYSTSVGQRLKMWQIGARLWQQHPLAGIGPGDFDDEMQALKDQGQYLEMELHNSLHNIYMQALVGTGLIGLAALLLAVFVFPLLAVLDNSKAGGESRLAGIVLLLTFAIFGLSESWTLRLPPVTVYLVYLLVTVSSLYREKAAPASG